MSEMLVKPKRYMILNFECHERSCMITLTTIDRCYAIVEKGKATLIFDGMSIILPYNEFFQCFTEV